MKKAILDVFRSPLRVIILLIALGCLSSPLYLHNMSSFQALVTNFCGLSHKAYISLTQVIEVFGWSLFVGVFSHFFWQIKDHEYKKFLPITIMGCIIIFIYTICRQAKDTMIYSVIPGETVVFAKILVVLFNIIYFSYYYIRLSKNAHYKNLLLIALLPILGYYVLFNYLLFENPAFIPSVATVVSWKAAIVHKLPGFLLPLMKHAINLVSQWPVVLYYILTEIFSVAVLSTVFWKLANRFVTSHERPRFYPAIMIASQIATFFSGMFTTYACKGAKGSSYMPIINKITILVCILCVILIATNWFFFGHVVPDYEDHSAQNKPKSSGGIISIIKENPKYLFIALLTVYYGFCSVFMEQFWKNTARIAYPNPIDYGSFVGNYIIVQSRTALVFTIFISNFCMNYCSWLTFASITPLLTIVGSGLLFSPLIIGNNLLSMITSYGPSLIVCTLGVYIIGLFKAVKYGSFDPSKEEYIAQQDLESRKDIKIVEGVTNRLGKAGGSVILALLFGLTSLTYQSKEVVILLFVSTAIMGILWLSTVISISKDVTPREEHIENK